MEPNKDDLGPRDGPNLPVVRLHAPDARLAGAVEVYFFVSISGAFEDRLYPEWGNIRIPLTGCWRHEGREGWTSLQADALFGPTDRWTRVAAQDGRGAGVLLTALGWERLVGTPAHLLANKVASLGNMLGQAGGSVADELCAAPTDTWDASGAAVFDRLLLARLDAMPENRPATLRAEAALSTRPPDAAAFAHAAGLSADMLRHVCRQAFGFTPKYLLRRQRLMDAVARIRAAGQPVRLGSLHGAGYADQPHFTREFVRFMEATPRGYLAAKRPLMREVALQWPEQVFPVTARNPDDPGK